MQLPDALLRSFLCTHAAQTMLAHSGCSDAPEFFQLGCASHSHSFQERRLPGMQLDSLDACKNIHTESRFRYSLVTLSSWTDMQKPDVRAITVTHQVPDDIQCHPAETSSLPGCVVVIKSEANASGHGR